MPQNNHRNEIDFSKYDTLSTEELSEILRLDSEAPEGNGLDIDTLLYITGVLAERKKLTNTGKTAQESWRSFQENYRNVNAENPACRAAEKAAVKKCRIRRAIAAAAILALLISVPLTAKALNWGKIWKTVACWAKETFSFIGENQQSTDGPNPGDNREFDSLQDALEYAKLPYNMVPTYIPDGYVLKGIDINETPIQKSYVALYEKEQQIFNISVRFLIETDPQNQEANNNIVETYILYGKEYYIINNNERCGAMWLQDSYECFISGDLTVDEIKRMLNSIPEG